METSARVFSPLHPQAKPGFAVYDFIDKAIAVVGILFSTNTIGTALNALNLPDAAVTPIRYLLPVIIFIRLLARYKATSKTLQSAPFLALFHLIVFASFFWSVNPEITITSLRSQYIQGIMIALFLATRFSMAQQIYLVSVGLGLGAMISLAYVFVFPSIGIHQDMVHSGSWRGIFYHKNYFSSVMALGGASFLTQLIDAGQRRWWQYAGLTLCVFLNLMSNSKTGQVLLVTIFAVIFLYRRYRWRGMKTVLVLYVFVVTAASAIVLLLATWDQFFIAIGRDPTLTGRTLIWDILRETYIPAKPFLGYGRDAFWESRLFSGLYFVPTHSHNGWYDMILDVGLVGLAVFLISAVRAWIRVLRLAYGAQRGTYLWPLAFFTVMFINNMTESLMLYQINILWVIYLSICWSLQETHQLHKLEDSQTEIGDRPRFAPAPPASSAPSGASQRPLPHRPYRLDSG